jgi:hypothetical protein
MISLQHLYCPCLKKSVICLCLFSSLSHVSSSLVSRSMASKSVSAVHMRDSQKVWSANALRMYRKVTLSRMRKPNFSENMAPLRHVNDQLLVLVLVSCRFFQPFWIFVLSKTIFQC